MPGTTVWSRDKPAYIEISTHEAFFVNAAFDMFFFALAVSTSQVEPGGARRGQEEPRGAQPEGARKSQEELGTP